jgi:hypothetical protein
MAKKYFKRICLREMFLNSGESIEDLLVSQSDVPTDHKNPRSTTMHFASLDQPRRPLLHGEFSHCAASSPLFQAHYFASQASIISDASVERGRANCMINSNAIL